MTKCNQFLNEWNRRAGINIPSWIHIDSECKEKILPYFHNKNNAGVFVEKFTIGKTMCLGCAHNYSAITLEVYEKKKFLWFKYKTLVASCEYQGGAFYRKEFERNPFKFLIMKRIKNPYFIIYPSLTISEKENVK